MFSTSGGELGKAFEALRGFMESGEVSVEHVLQSFVMMKVLNTGQKVATST